MPRYVEVKKMVDLEVEPAFQQAQKVKVYDLELISVLDKLTSYVSTP